MLKYGRFSKKMIFVLTNLLLLLYLCAVHNMLITYYQTE